MTRSALHPDQAIRNNATSETLIRWLDMEVITIVALPFRRMARVTSAWPVEKPTVLALTTRIECPHVGSADSGFPLRHTYPGKNRVFSMIAVISLASAWASIARSFAS